MEELSDPSSSARMQCLMVANRVNASLVFFPNYAVGRNGLYIHSVQPLPLHSVRTEQVVLTCPVERTMVFIASESDSWHWQNYQSTANPWPMKTIPTSVIFS